MFVFIASIVRGEANVPKRADREKHLNVIRGHHRLRPRTYTCVITM